MRVLVVDDEELMLNAIRRVLRDVHVVVAFRSASEAMRRLAEDRGFDVILCDLMMPDMTGMTFHDEVVKLYPELASRMVFMTGGAFAPAAREFLGRVDPLCIQKPFSPDQLLEALSRAAQGPDNLHDSR